MNTHSSEHDLTPSPEVRTRIDELRRELDDAIENAKIRAKGDYWISFFLMLIALGASAVAGIGGLSEKFGSQLTGSLALIPGAIAVLASNLKFQQKSNWHYRRCRASLALKSKLVLQLPETPTVDDVATLAAERDAMEVSMEREWVEKFSLNFAEFTHRSVT